MYKLIFTLCLAATTLVFADKIVTDNSMAAADRSDDMSYIDRGSFGPYIEFNSVNMDNVDYSYKVLGYNQKISVTNTAIYGATGTLPIKEWFDIFIMAGYQHIGVSHEPKDLGIYEDLNEILEWYEDFPSESPLDSNDVKGHHNIHTALFQFGFDFTFPLIASYNYQLMVKPYIFAGVLVGKTFFSDNTNFLSPVLYGYAYGAGVRAAWHGVFLSAGVRSTREYFHTNYERRVDHEKKDDNEFILDFNTYFQPFLSVGITLF